MIDDRYDMRAPLPSNAVDLFRGEWAGEIPGFASGPLPLFNDPRVRFFEETVGSFSGKRILELGPLEASHTFMMLSRGAESVLAIEANTRSFLKCLVVKQILNLDRSYFILGDFMKYLDHPARFDICIASGVLYHMREPLRLLEGATRAANDVCIWTHYYDHGLISSN